MNADILELYRNGEPTGLLFLSAENAKLWISRHGDGAEYEIRSYCQ